MTSCRARSCLLCHQLPGWRHCAFRRCRPDRECQPGVPARWPVGRVEFTVSFQIQIPLHVSNRENVTDLRADPEHPRSEASKNRAPAGIVRNLLIGISDETDKELLREKLRCTPVKMEIDTALNPCIGILEVIGKATDASKFVPSCRVEVGVAAAAVDSAVTDADIKIRFGS